MSEPVASPFIDDEHAFAVALRLFLLGRQLFFLDGNSVFAGQIAQGFGIAQLLVLHDEAHGISTLAAGEALAIILGRRHHKGGGAVVVERAEALEVGSRTAQRDEVGHHIHDVGGIHYLVYGHAVYHIPNP